MAPAQATHIEQLYYGQHRLSFRIGTYLALIRMMGIAHLVTSLYGHAQLVSDTHTRLARTRQTLRDLICSGFDSPSGQAAVQRLRDVHRHLNASPDDFRYVLATFFLEPLRWNAGHARTKITANEEDLLLAFWTRVGQAMGIEDLPVSLAEWKHLQRNYEARNMAYSPQGHRLACMCLRDVVKLTLPIGTRWTFRQWMIETLEPAVRDTLGVAKPRWYARLPARVLRSVLL
jgi:hypothetical protein